MIDITKNSSLPTDLTKKLKKAMSAAPPPPPVEDPIYHYLRQVYYVRRQLESEPEWKKALSELGDAQYGRLAREYIRLIIEITSGAHVTAKMKHKYSAALQHALANDVKAKNLGAFIKKAGGLNGCVTLAGKSRQPQKSKRVVRQTTSRGKLTSMSRIHTN
jgi:hypothetical protein